MQKTPTVFQESPQVSDLHALQRFVASVPALRDALTAPMSSTHELLLRSEIRRTMRELSGTLKSAAREEPDHLRAAIFLAVSRVAADLAAGHSSAPPSH